MHATPLTNEAHIRWRRGSSVQYGVQARSEGDEDKKYERHVLLGMERRGS